MSVQDAHRAGAVAAPCGPSPGVRPRRQPGARPSRGPVGRTRRLPSGIRRNGIAVRPSPGGAHGPPSPGGDPVGAAAGHPPSRSRCRDVPARRVAEPAAAPIGGRRGRGRAPRPVPGRRVHRRAAGPAVRARRDRGRCPVLPVVPPPGRGGPHPASPPADREAPGDRPYPGLRTGVRPQIRPPSPAAHERLLDDVLGLVEIAGHQVHLAHQPRHGARVELLELVVGHMRLRRCWSGGEISRRIRTGGGPRFTRPARFPAGVLWRSPARPWITGTSDVSGCSRCPPSYGPRTDNPS